MLVMNNWGADQQEHLWEYENELTKVRDWDTIQILTAPSHECYAIWTEDKNNGRCSLRGDNDFDLAWSCNITSLNFLQLVVRYSLSASPSKGIWMITHPIIIDKDGLLSLISQLENKRFSLSLPNWDFPEQLVMRLLVNRLREIPISARILI